MALGSRAGRNTIVGLAKYCEYGTKGANFITDLRYQ